MLLNIRHVSRYQYDQPVKYALQRLKLRPQNSPGQVVRDWRVEVEGATSEATYLDGFGNSTQLLRLKKGAQDIVISAIGNVDVDDRAGVFGQVYGIAPIWVFERETSLTLPGKAIREFAAGISAKSDGLATMHDLMATIHQRVAYVPGSTTTFTDAETAFVAGQGVCQDHAHIFISVARLLGIPARYVSGYLMLEDRIEQTASHAWAEVHLNGLGWVGFDAANDICPNDRYVRIATGLDYRDAAPVSGIRLGAASETLAVQINVEQ